MTIPAQHPRGSAGCPNFQMSNDVHFEYTSAVADARRAQGSADMNDLVKAAARIEAAADRIKWCMIDAPHPLPHRDENGVEWGLADDEPEMVPVPDHDALADWIGDMDEARNVEQGDTGEYVTVLTIDVDTLASRIIEHLLDQS